MNIKPNLMAWCGVAVLLGSVLAARGWATGTPAKNAPKVVPVKAVPIEVEVKKAEAKKVVPVKAVPIKAEVKKIEVKKAEVKKIEVKKAEVKKIEVKKAVPVKKVVPAKAVPVKKAVPAKAVPVKKAEAKKAEAKKAPKKVEPAKKALVKKPKEPKAPPKPKLPPIAKWERPDVEKVRADVFAWLDKRKVDAATRAKADEVWSFDPEEITGTELLVRVAATFALADANAKKVVDLCSRPRIDLVPPSFAWLVDPKSERLVTNNLRLLFARWLAHESLHDEAMQQLDGLNPGDVVDPASLLFYQSVVYHWLLVRESGLRSIEGLLKSPEQSPRRYVVLASLMQMDLQGLKDDSLDHIARRMDDIERRLDLGRSGKRVRKIEDGVIASLDKIIKKLEEEQKKGGGGGAGAGKIQSSSPAPDSKIMGGKGPGNVTKRNIGSKSGWGDLPPKEREEALQQIGRDFPSHYRDKVEQYYRKLAAEAEKSSGE